MVCRLWQSHLAPRRMTIGTCSRIATHLDAESLGQRTTIAPIGTPLTSLPLVSDLDRQLAGRFLLRYLTADKVGSLLMGTAVRQFVTPTPYAPGETISWLALPPAPGPRTWVLLLKPTELNDVYGPRWVQYGGGVEYVLESGFSVNAIADVAPGPLGSSRWELEVK
jgi:hypothetical protein